LEVRLAGKKAPAHFLDQNGKETEIGQLLHVSVEPSLYQGPVLLEVSYQADSNRMDKNSFLQQSLQPPHLIGAIQLGRARWEIDLPPGWIPVPGRTSANVEQRWGWWGWLLAPRPALSRLELEQWLGGTTMLSSPLEGESSLICWQSDLGTLSLVQVPQRLWLLVCSLTVLVLGLGLWLTPLAPAFRWSCLAVIAIAVGTIAIASPVALPAIVYGSEPGIVVLLFAVASQWMLHVRYRRQVVLMPGFTRLKPGSSIVRGGLRPHDPSTVDEPPKRPSSIVPGSNAP
jgi:hypothetical protein